MEFHVIGSKLPEVGAEKGQLDLIKSTEVKPEEVHPSLRSIISQYDSEDEKDEEQFQTEGELPLEAETNTGGELLQNEGVNTEAKLKQDEDDEEEDEDVVGDVEEEDGDDAKMCAVPRLQDRLKRNRNHEPNPFETFEYGYNIPSPSTEVSGSESEDEYKPNVNVVKTKASLNKRFKKKSKVVKVKVEEKVEEDAAAEKTLNSGKCQDCGKIFSHRWNLTRHMQRGVCHREPKCGICSKPFSDVSTLKQHVQTHFPMTNSNKSFKCCKCNQEFSRKDGLKRHLVRCHPDEDAEKLLERFTNTKGLQEKPRVNYSSKSSGKKLRHCRSKVKYQVSSSSQSEESRPTSENEEAFGEDEEFQLPTALRTNASASYKNEVLEQPSKETDGELLQLGMEESLDERASSVKRKLLSTVSNTVERDKVLKSDNLPKRASGTVGRRNFKCDFCGKCWKDNYSLLAHRRVHTGERPFQCPICKDRFARKFRLSVHLRKIHNTTPEAAKTLTGQFKCIECDSRFTQSSNLNRHMKKFHPRWDGWQLPPTLDAFQSTDANINIKQESSSPAQDKEDYTDILDYLRFSDDEESDRFFSQNNGILSFSSTSKQFESSTFVKSANFSCFDDDDVMPLILPYLRKLKRNKKKLLANNMIRLEVDGAEEEDKKVVVEIDKGLLSCFLPTVPIDRPTSAEIVNKMEDQNALVEEMNEDINTPGTMALVEDLNEDINTPGTMALAEDRNENFSLGVNGDPMEVIGADDVQFTNVKISRTENRKPFTECPYCKKRFMHNFQMKRHVVIHADVKPHECSICKRRFNQKQNLQNHIRLHTGERPYHCPSCHMRFTSPQTLYQHKKRSSH